MVVGSSPTRPTFENSAESRFASAFFLRPLGGENIGWLAELFPSLAGDFFAAPKDYFYVWFSAADCAHKFADCSLNFMCWLNIKKFSQCGGGVDVETKTLRLVLRCKPGGRDVYVYAYPTMGILQAVIKKAGLNWAKKMR